MPQHDPEQGGDGPYRSPDPPPAPKERWSRGAIAAVSGAVVGWGLIFFGRMTGYDTGPAQMIGFVALVASLAIGILTMNRLGVLKKAAELDATPPDQPPERGHRLAKLSVALVLVPVALAVVGTCLLFLACMGR